MAADSDVGWHAAGSDRVVCGVGAWRCIRKVAGLRGQVAAGMRLASKLEHAQSAVSHLGHACICTLLSS